MSWVDKWDDNPQLIWRFKNSTLHKNWHPPNHLRNKWKMKISRPFGEKWWNGSIFVKTSSTDSNSSKNACFWQQCQVAIGTHIHKNLSVVQTYTHHLWLIYSYTIPFDKMIHIGSQCERNNMKQPHLTQVFAGFSKELFVEPGKWKFRKKFHASY